MINGKKILIVGGTGSLGNMLVEKYISSNYIIIYSRNETNQWKMKQKFNDNSNISFFIGDIADVQRLNTIIDKTKPNIIIVAAALKHIDICEKNTSESLKTNIKGIKNITDIISNNSSTMDFLETVLFISTDKACEPVNVYGMCKSISERIMVEASENIPDKKFINVRYGNVLLSNGSLIPLYKSIGEDPNKKNFMITDVNMTRFFMTLEDSFELINYALENGESGDTVIPKNILSYKISDIAEFFCNKYDKPIEIGSLRPGEKLHENLISFTESIRTIEKDDYYIIKPTYKTVSNPYIFYEGFKSSLSIQKLTDDIIKKFDL